MASLRVLRRFKTKLNMLELCSSQSASKMFQRSLLLSSPIYENNNSENQSSKKDKVQKFRKIDHENPIEKTFRILYDDVKNYYVRKKNTIQQIMNQAKEDVAMKTDPSKETETPYNAYNFVPRTSEVTEAVWPAHCDVLVVGGGAVGSSIAYHLKENARDGLSVVVVEEDPTVSQILY